MICHQTLGSEDLAARSFPSALTHLKIAYEIGRSAGNTVELPSIAYDFGIAAMYVIHLAPSPATSKETSTSPASSSSSSASLASPSSSPVSRRSTTSPLFKPSPLSSKTAAGEDENSNVNKESPYTSHPLRPIAHSPATHAAGVLDPGEKAVAVAAAAAEREKVERIIEEAIAAVEGDNSGSSSSDSEDEDGEGKTREVERKRFNFRRFRSVSYSKFDKFKAASSKSTTSSTTSTAADTATSPAPPVSPSSPEATSSTSTSTAAAGVPPKRPYVKAKSFGARLRGGGGSKTPTFSPPPTLSTPGKSESLPVLPSPPLTPPVGMSAQVTESGITTNDISLAASALSYLFRLVSTKQGLPELQVKTPHVLGLPFDDEDNEKLWGGEMKLSDEDLVVGTPQILSSQVLFKKAELCYMMSRLYSWVGQGFLGEQYGRQATGFAVDFRLVLNLPAVAEVFPVFNVDDQAPLPAISPKPKNGILSKLTKRFTKVSVS